MTTAVEHHAFNDAFAIMIHCDDQQEIDKYWNAYQGRQRIDVWLVHG